MTRPLLRITLLCLAVVLSFSAVAFADLDFQIHLQNRQFTPDDGAVTLAKSAQLVDKHILIQFDRPLDEADKDRLLSNGILLLDYIPNYAYVAIIDRSLNSFDLDINDIRWLGLIQPADKISPMFDEIGIGDWARRGGDLVQFTIVVQSDIDMQEAADRFINDFSAQIIGFEPSVGAIELIMPENALFRMSERDEVLWIEQAMPPQEEHNNSCRDNLQVGPLQDPPYGLSGVGVTVAEWDGGQVDDAHLDFSGRIRLGNMTSISTHATHVAGTVIGNGAESGGTYKGMAPSARLVSFLWWSGTTELNNEYLTAISAYNSTVATNSWGLGVGDPASLSSCNSILGNYFTACATIDNLVRGDNYDPITICWSAGNQRSGASKYCGSLGWTYRTIGVYGTSKNTITVGAINSNNNTMTSFSSWGPTDDGRIKPDVVGPGCQSGGDGGVTSVKPGSGYTTMCGTSMSTPAVAGTAALLIEQYANSGFLGRPLASTIKGILINSATDLGNTGPDFAYGHGAVNGLAAVDKIASGEPSYFESDISTGIVHLYDLTVPGNADLLRVTLVWDDPGGTSVANKTLINDLDLELIDPFGTIVQTWVLDTGIALLPATRGVDRINNVETVGILNPDAGLWKARVIGFNIPQGPQNYSLVFTPDSIYTPGNLAAVAVYDNGDFEEQPGDTVSVDFWVTNIGAARDSFVVTVGDNNGWLISTINAVVALDPYDSSYYTVDVVIPPGSAEGDNDSVFCTAASLINIGVEITDNVDVTAGAYYGLDIIVPTDDTSGSPDVILVSFNIQNFGNSLDQIVVTSVSDDGWYISPAYQTVSIPPFADSTIQVSIQVPAEVPHLSLNNVTMTATSSGGPSVNSAISILTENPYFPPSLSNPGTGAFIQSTTPQFEWSGVGDSATLFIAEDITLSVGLKTFSGIIGQSLALPLNDSLIDGKYYWAVMQYYGVNPSSLQATPYSFVVDNSVPNALAALSPANGAFATNKIFSLTGGWGKSGAAAVTAPEYNIFEIASDTAFTNIVQHNEPITTSTYSVNDTLTEGRWFWRIQRVDSAGNAAPVSTSAAFVLDSETPPVPVQLEPAVGLNVKGDITIKWNRGAVLPAWEFAPETYHIQIYNSSFNVIHESDLTADSIVIPEASFENGELYYWRVRNNDLAGHSSNYQGSPFTFTYLAYVCGDINGAFDGSTISDLTYLVDFLFRGGPAPDPLIAGSINCDNEVNVSDITYLVDYLFKNGPAPCCQ